MIIIDLMLLDRFRSSRKCEYCGKPTPAGCHPCHISARGMGGGKRVDIPENLASMCPLCHHKQHGQNRDPSLEDMWAIAAKREGITVEECKQRVWEIQRS